MKCTGQELFNALTQRDMIQIFTNSEAKENTQIYHFLDMSKFFT